MFSNKTNLYRFLQFGSDYAYEPKSSVKTINLLTDDERKTAHEILNDMNSWTKQTKGKDGGFVSVPMLGKIEPLHVVYRFCPREALVLIEKLFTGELDCKQFLTAYDQVEGYSGEAIDGNSRNIMRITDSKLTTLCRSLKCLIEEIYKNEMCLQFEFKPSFDRLCMEAIMIDSGNTCNDKIPLAQKNKRIGKQKAKSFEKLIELKAQWPTKFRCIKHLILEEHLQMILEKKAQCIKWSLHGVGVIVDHRIKDPWLDITELHTLCNSINHPDLHSFLFLMIHIISTTGVYTLTMNKEKCTNEGMAKMEVEVDSVLHKSLLEIEMMMKKIKKGETVDRCVMFDIFRFLFLAHSSTLSTNYKGVDWYWRCKSHPKHCTFHGIGEACGKKGHMFLKKAEFSHSHLPPKSKHTFEEILSGLFIQIRINPSSLPIALKLLKLFAAKIKEKVLNISYTMIPRFNFEWELIDPVKTTKPKVAATISAEPNKIGQNVAGSIDWKARYDQLPMEMKEKDAKIGELQAQLLG